MRRFPRYIASLFLATALIVPVASMGCSRQVRVYDESHGEYHNWDDHEETVYKGYLSDNHRDYKPFNQLSKEDQKSYWDWRHSHPEK